MAKKAITSLSLSPRTRARICFVLDILTHNCNIVVAYLGKLATPGDGLSDSRIERHANGNLLQVLSLGESLRVRQHSPTGFSWGYNGSGPHQTALAICLDLLADESAALESYEIVLRHIVSRLPQDSEWTVSAHNILAVLLADQR